MGAGSAVLVGVKGLVEGEVYKLDRGTSVVIGRSRSCDISLRECKRWQEAEAAGEPVEEGPKTVSRRHLKISYLDDDNLELEDLSSNGSFVDGRRVDRLVITDVKETPHEIQLGAGEAFRLEWR